jgi:hypothetical protein
MRRASKLSFYRLGKYLLNAGELTPFRFRAYLQRILLLHAPAADTVPEPTGVLLHV